MLKRPDCLDDSWLSMSFFCKETILKTNKNAKISEQPIQKIDNWKKASYINMALTYIDQ